MYVLLIVINPINYLPSARYLDRVGMSHMDALLQEVFRFRSITPLVMHKTPQDTTLQVSQDDLGHRPNIKYPVS